MKTQALQQPAWAYGHRGHALFTTLRQMASSRRATLLTLVVLGISMTLPALILFASDDIAKLPAHSGRGQSMTVYLDTSVSDLQGAEIARELASRDAIDEVKFISRTEALGEFQTHSEFADALDVLEENPLPAAIVVYPASSAQTRDSAALLSRQLQAQQGVSSVQVDLRWVERLSAIFTLTKLVTLLLAVLLTLTSLVVIANTLRLEVLQRKKETEVAQLLGATQRFVSRSYVYLGATYGLLGGLIAVILATFLQLLVNPAIQRLASAYGASFQLTIPTLAQTGIILATSLFLGLLGAFFTLFRPAKTIKHVL